MTPLLLTFAMIVPVPRTVPSWVNPPSSRRVPATISIVPVLFIRTVELDNNVTPPPVFRKRPALLMAEPALEKLWLKSISP